MTSRATQSACDGSGTLSPSMTVDCGAPARSMRANPPVRGGGLRRRGDSGAARPRVEGLADAGFHRRRIEHAGDIEAGAARGEMIAVKRPHLLERVAREHRLGREQPAVRMVAVHQLGELLLGRCLWRALANRQVTHHVRLDARQFRLRQARPRGDVRDELHGLDAVIAEDLGGNRRGVRADPDAELPAHRRELARERIGGQRGRALAHHVAGEVGEPDLVLAARARSPPARPAGSSPSAPGRTAPSSPAARSRA